MQQLRELGTDKVPTGSPDEPSGNAEQEIDETLCVFCKERERDYSASSRSISCRECREEQLKLRIPVGNRLFLALVFVSFLFSLFMLPKALANYRTYLDARRNMEAKQYSSACDKYMSLLDTYSNSIPITIKASEAALSAQRFYDLAYIFNTHWVGRRLNDSEYEIAMEYSDFLDSYFATMDEIMTIFTEQVPEQPQADAQSATDAIQSELKALLLRDDLVPPLVYYYLGSTSPDAAEAASYLRLASELDPRITFPGAFYGNALRRAGRFGEARDVYQMALERNAEDANAFRGLSILELLDGNRESALTTARKAYELDPMGLYIPETLIVMLRENGLQDEADALLDEITALGFEADAEFAEYLEGKVSARHYFTE